MLSEPDGDLDELARMAIDAALEVHRILGPGFPETIYEAALAVELGLRSVPFERQVPLAIHYKGTQVGLGRADFMIGGLVVELKSVDHLAEIHIAQVLSYLKATGRRLGLLINFNVQALRTGVRRVVLSRPK